MGSFWGHFGVILGIRGWLRVTSEPFWGHSPSKLDQKSFKTRLRAVSNGKYSFLRRIFGTCWVHFWHIRIAFGPFWATLEPHWHILGVTSWPLGGQKGGFVWSKVLEAVLQNCAPRVGRKPNFEKHRLQWIQSGPKADRKRTKNEKVASMATKFTKKKNGVMHAVVFVDGAPGAKNAQVVGRLRNSEGLKMRKNAIGTAKGPRGANTMPKNALFEATWGVKKVGFFDRKCF